MKKLSPADLKKHVDLINSQKPILKDIVFVENGVEVSGQIFVKKISYQHMVEIEKSYQWEPHPDDEGLVRVIGFDEVRLRAAQLLATICVDDQGTPFFKDIDEVLHSYMQMCKAMWNVANDVNLFLGKLTTTNSKKTKSSRNSRSTASAETASKASEPTLATGNSSTGENTATDADV